MRIKTLLSAILFAQLIFIHAVGAQAKAPLTPLPDLSPLPLSQQLSSMREPLPVDTIVDAALEFSGATDADAAAAKDKLAALVRRFSDEVANVTSQAELGEKALIFLHKNLFSGYSTLQTRVDTALDTGIYNCVSSAVLYMIVARSVGLSVAGVRTTDHAFCTVLINGQPVDVETTNPLGFNPGREEGVHRFVRQGHGLLLRAARGLPRPAEHRGKRASQPDPLQPGLGELGRARLPGGPAACRELHSPFWAPTKAEAPDRRLHELHLVVGHAAAVRPGGAVHRHGESVIRWNCRHRAAAPRHLSQLDREPLDRQRTPGRGCHPRTARVRATLQEADWTELSVDVFQLRAQAQADTGDYTAAAATVADGLKKLGRPEALLRAYEIYVHNSVAVLFNARKLTEARTVVDQALTVYPDSPMLQQDLDLIRKSK